MPLRKPPGPVQLDLFEQFTHERSPDLRPDGGTALADALPRLVRDLEKQGQLQQALLEAQEKTTDEMFRATRDLMASGRTAEQAHREAWELARERYILIPPEQR